MSKRAIALSEKHFDLVVAQGDHHIGNVVAVEIVGGDGDRSAMDWVLRPFLEFAVRSTEEHGDLVSTGTSQYNIGVRVTVKRAAREASRLPAAMELHLVVKTPISVSEQDGQGVTADIGRDKIGNPILIDVEWRDSRGILADFVAGKIIKQVRRDVGILLGTRHREAEQEHAYQNPVERPKQGDSACSHGPTRSETRTQRRHR